MKKKKSIETTVWRILFRDDTR